ncbi:MAG: hypothetical protein ACREUG_08755 [Steroidobacteraceae bacterium]
MSTNVGIRAEALRGQRGLFHLVAGKALVHERYRAMLRDWSVPYRELRVPTCLGQTFVIRCGREVGPQVVLLHGGMTTSAMWARIAGGERHSIT